MWEGWVYQIQPDTFEEMRFIKGNINKVPRRNQCGTWLTDLLSLQLRKEGQIPGTSGSLGNVKKRRISWICRHHMKSNDKSVTKLNSLQRLFKVYFRVLFENSSRIGSAFGLVVKALLEKPQIRVLRFESWLDSHSCVLLMCILTTHDDSGSWILASLMGLYS